MISPSQPSLRAATVVRGLVLVLAALTFSNCRTTLEADRAASETAILAVLEQQAKDWNEGSIEKFMRGYSRSETTRFASGGNVRLGWQAVLDRYQQTYGDRAAMGTLTFSDIDIRVLSADAALAFGRWHLKRDKDEPSGLFTLLFRKTADGWRIVHDHTSAAEKN
ncbi:MAG: DUF4440 domain-containing protein [Verrucomicrobia bacterium]|nr:DUF4440 domain-containing protein [Verrucomicrobiota bacterium]